MESSEEDGLIVARLDEGEDIFSDIEALSKKYYFRNALILSGIGMLENPVVGYFDQKKYIEHKFEGCYELLAMHGSVADGTTHIHLAMGNEKSLTFGGHLLGAKVKVNVELVIQKLNRIKLSRIPKGDVKILGVKR
jgi:predicted DNA-binding protein with PD1-like motif